MKTSISIAAACLAIVFLSTFGRAYAVELEVSGNGAASNNSIQIQQNNTSSVVQSNQANVQNDVEANADTGSNETDNGSIQTGDANIFVTIKNFFNRNSAEVICCPAGSTPTPSVSDPGNPTPTKTLVTPTPPAMGGGGGGTNGGNAAPTTSTTGIGGSGAVLGLSAASGEATTQRTFTLLGLLCVSLGGALVRTKNIHIR